MKNNKGERRPHLYIGAWLAGIAFTLAKGLDRDPWGVGVFDLDLISLLTGYLFLSVGSVQTAVFALGQGFLVDVFSVAPRGLSALTYFGVFWGMYLGSLYLNLQTAKGQAIIVSSVVLIRWLIWGGTLFLLYGDVVMVRSLGLKAAVSIVGTGVIAAPCFALLDRLSGAPAEDGGPPPLERIKPPLARRPLIIMGRTKEVRSVNGKASRQIPDNRHPGTRPPLAE